jgi:hypothetical protein
VVPAPPPQDVGSPVVQAICVQAAVLAFLAGIVRPWSVALVPPAFFVQRLVVRRRVGPALAHAVATSAVVLSLHLLVRGPVLAWAGPLVEAANRRGRVDVAGVLLTVAAGAILLVVPLGIAALYLRREFPGAASDASPPAGEASAST